MLTHCVCVYLTMGRSQERQLNLSTSCLGVNTNTTLGQLLISPPAVCGRDRGVDAYFLNAAASSLSRPSCACSFSLMFFHRFSSCFFTESNSILFSYGHVRGQHLPATVHTLRPEHYLPSSPSPWRACGRLCASPAPGLSPCSEAPSTCCSAAQNPTAGD